MESLGILTILWKAAILSSSAEHPDGGMSTSELPSKGRNVLWKQGTRIQELPKLTHGGSTPKARRCNHTFKKGSQLGLLV